MTLTKISLYCILNSVYSRHNLLEIKNEGWIALYVNAEKVKHFESFVVAHIPKESENSKEIKI